MGFALGEYGWIEYGLELSIWGRGVRAFSHVIYLFEVDGFMFLSSSLYSFPIRCLSFKPFYRDRFGGVSTSFAAQFTPFRSLLHRGRFARRLQHTRPG